MERYEFVFRLPEDASLEFRSSEPGGALGGSGVPASDGRPLSGYRCVSVAFPKSASTVNFDFTVASGDWTTIYEHGPTGSHSMQGRRVGDTDWTVLFTTAVENADGSTLLSTLRTRRWSRILASLR